MCTRTTAGAGRLELSCSVADSCVPSDAAKLTVRPAADVVDVTHAATAMAAAARPARTTKAICLSLPMPLAGDGREEITHRRTQSHKQRVADERMPDRDLREVRQRMKQREVAKIQIVPGIDAEAELVGNVRGLAIGLEAR